MSNNVKVIVANTKHDCEHLLGQFLDESHFDLLIEEDCDFYMPASGFDKGATTEENLLFKFRKGVFTEDEQKAAYDGLIDAAVESQNRGLASGPKGEKLGNRDWVTDWQLAVLEAMMNPTSRLDGKDEVDILIAQKDSYKEDSTRGLVWLRKKITSAGESYDGFFDRWIEKVRHYSADDRKKVATEFAKTCISQTTYANPVMSGIAGFFDRYPRYPYGRVCSYNQKNPEKFEKAFPYLRTLDKKFAELVPERYAAQKACADRLDSRFRVAGTDTVFTTLTINKTFRTAAHRDAGDLSQGFSNLGVINAGKNFKGGYLVLPEFRVAVNIRPGDLLLINNHEGIHGNTKIVPADPNHTDEDIVRMSLVCYFRENMLQLGSWEYETARRDFVESRRLNESHPMWRPLWNGVSSNMFSSAEWATYLVETDRRDLLETYHPELLHFVGGAPAESSLEDFFA